MPDALPACLPACCLLPAAAAAAAGAAAAADRTDSSLGLEFLRDSALYGVHRALALGALSHKAWQASVAGASLHMYRGTILGRLRGRNMPQVMLKCEGASPVQGRCD